MNVANKLRERFEILTAREKVIVTVTLIIALWGGWDRIFWSSLKQQQDRLHQELSDLDQRLDAQRQTAAQLEAGIAKPADQAKKNQLAALTAELTHLQNRLTQEGQHFVPPRRMADALSDLLNRNRHLTLIKLDTLPVATLRPEKNLSFPIYKHGLALTFSGDYANTLAYLRALETLPWRIYWDSIDYQVKNHPLAETTIRAYTLSFEESWLGV